MSGVNVISRTNVECPDQRVPESKKTQRMKEDSFNHYTELAINGDIDRELIKSNFNAIYGELDEADYSYVLRPYGQGDTRKFPARLRNIDIIGDIFRRYMGEYGTSNHDFIVKTNDADYNTRKQQSIDTKIDKELTKLFNNSIVKEFGLDTELNQEVKAEPFGKFVNYETTSYEDSQAISGQMYLNHIVDATESDKLYQEAYAHWIISSRAISYREINNNDIDKEIVHPVEYYRAASRKPFIEDDPYGCRLQYMSITEIDAKFGKKLKKKERDYIIDILAHGTNDGGAVNVPLGNVKSKHNGEQYASFYSTYSDSDCLEFAGSADKIPVYHTFWLTEREIKILTYVDELGIEQQMEVEPSYKMDKAIGDISVESDYEQAYMIGYRIGGIDAGVYMEMDYHDVQRNDLADRNEVKAPYNGITEIVAGYKFALGDILAPFQALYNIFYYHRERIIARNDGNLLIMPEGLIVDSENFTQADRLYYAKADGKLYIDDTNPAISTLVNAIKTVELGDHNLIMGLSELLVGLKEEARETVDMNRQRYGDIQTSAGKGVTEQAIIKSSTGTHPITRKFEWFIERDHNADIDYSRLAWRDGKKASYINGDFETVSFEVNPMLHRGTSYDVHVKSAMDEANELRAFKELAFSAGQNGEFGIAAKAIRAKNSAKVEKLLEGYQEKIDARNSAQQESSERIAQAAQQFEAQSRQEDNQLTKYGYDTDYAKAIQVKLLEIQARASGGADVSTELADVAKDIEGRVTRRDDLEYNKNRDVAKDNLKREEMLNNRHIAEINKN